MTQEIRHDRAYLHWDSIGRVWHEMARELPGIELLRGEPAVTSFRWKNQYELAATLERAHVIGHLAGSDTREFFDISEKFVELLVSRLEIEVLTRIGFRVQYLKRYESREMAANAIDALRLTALSDITLFGIKSNETKEFVIRREDETLGVLLRIQPQTETIDADFPPSFHELRPIHSERHGLLIDVDYYTLTPVSSDLYRPRPWMELAGKTIKESIEELLGGGNGSKR